MHRIPDGTLDDATQAHLTARQDEIDRLSDYAERVAHARTLWESKTGTAAGKRAFKAVREELSCMCFGAVRCAYCTDSAADEIEHVLSKTHFPDHAFRWANYVFACGPCNGTYKRSNYAYLDGAGMLRRITKAQASPILLPPGGCHALIDPRTEDPSAFLAIDLLGPPGPDGKWRFGEFRLWPREGLDPVGRQRAEYTRDTLGLDRPLLLKARRNAFENYHARLREYAEDKRTGTSPAELAAKREGILRMDHPMVFVEMQRQHEVPPLKRLFDAVPEALEWRFGRLGPITA